MYKYCSPGVRNYSYLLSEDFKPEADFVKVLYEFHNSMHIEYCLMVSNTILVDTAKLRSLLMGCKTFTNPFWALSPKREKNIFLE